MDKVLISLFDFTGNASKPYREAGWHVFQVDIQHNIDVLLWDYKSWFAGMFNKYGEVKYGVIAMIPCTDYALSGAKHFAAKDADGRTSKSQQLVDKTKEIIEYLEGKEILIFWQVENPMSRIHKLNPWMNGVRLKFNPCDYAGYDPIPDNSRYNKRTWLWGNFNIPEKKRLEPLKVDNPGWKKYGGKSLKTKNARSITPLGFAYAFYDANH